ncbi:MAG: hypothetical protein WAN11_11860 [Syntrophobacteraceae bacterium]
MAFGGGSGGIDLDAIPYLSMTRSGTPKLLLYIRVSGWIPERAQYGDAYKLPPYPPGVRSAKTE